MEKQEHGDINLGDITAELFSICDISTDMHRHSHTSTHTCAHTHTFTYIYLQIEIPIVTHLPTHKHEGLKEKTLYYILTYENFMT